MCSSDLRFMDTMQELREIAGLPASGGPGVTVERAAAASPVGLAELLEAVLSRSGYLEALEAERTIEAQGRIENLEQLVEVGREFDAAAEEETGTLEVFLQQIALVADADARRDEDGLITLMTVHNAKGLEYPVVFITGCEDGVFPHSRAVEEGGLEEERRLFYVGVTRAMRELYLSYALRRAVFGANVTGMRSRFLDEIPAELFDEPAGRVDPFASAWRADGGLFADRRPREVHAGASSPGPSWASAGGQPVPAGTFRLGEDVVHAAFGEGVVTGVEPDGVIVVRFATDGSERKLMAEYAPVSRR